MSVSPSRRFPEIEGIDVLLGAAARAPITPVVACAFVDPSALRAVTTTTGTEEEARRLARTIVERRLAACAHVDPIESHYVWKGAVQNENEWRVVFKTTAARYADVEQAIKELHSYELPAIYATELVHVHAPYAAWLEENTAGEAR